MIDPTTERCPSCDGHWLHTPDCEYFEADITANPELYRRHRPQTFEAWDGARRLAEIGEEEAAEAYAEAFAAQYDNDPNPYEGTYSEE